MPDDASHLPELSHFGPPELPRLGEYQLLEKLGEGGMGVVYRAMHIEMGRTVAVKVLTRECLQDDRSVARFKREMVAVAKLDHPHVVRAFDAREVGGTRLLVMEDLDGLPLDELAVRLGPLPIADACELIRQAADGLQHVHEHGLVHRDIKPSNLLLARRDGRTPIVKILDLGLARLHGDWASADAMTSPGLVLGTPDYMAPEQIADSHNVDIRADIYSLGCTLFRLIAGRAPFAGIEPQSAIQIMAAQASETPQSICEVRPEAPPELAEIIAKMLEKAPPDRYATPREVCEHLERFCLGANLRLLLSRADNCSECFVEGNTRTTQASLGSSGHVAAAGGPPPIPPPKHSTSITRLPQRTQPLPRTSRGTRRGIALLSLLRSPWGIRAALACLLVLFLALFMVWHTNDDGHRRQAREADTTSNGAVAEQDGAPRAGTLRGAPRSYGAGAPGAPLRSWLLCSWTDGMPHKPDLWLFSSDGQTKLPVMRTPDTFETQPTFSPDGRRIAFIRSDRLNTNTSLWICRLDGMEPQQLVPPTFGPERIMAPLWASDRELYFTWQRGPARDPASQLWRVDCEDKRPTSVCDLGQRLNLSFAVATHLAIEKRELLVLGRTSSDVADTDVYLTDLEGSLLRTVWRDLIEPHYDGAAIRSPDGQQIVWQHDFQAPGTAGARYGLAWATQTEAGHWPVSLMRLPDDSIMPLGWSADGRELLCVRGAPGRFGQATADFFFTDKDFRNLHSLFQLENWYLPHGTSTGRIADWRVLPADARLPNPKVHSISGLPTDR